MLVVYLNLQSETILTIMKKVLIITPNWPPIICPDMQRVRIVLPFLHIFGWEPLILKINPEEQEGAKDYQLAQTLPTGVKTWQANCIPKKFVRWFGLNNAGLRSFFHLAHLGSQIIKKEKPYLVFFSTTTFPLMILGWYWHSWHNMPYILDFQDPWYNDYYKQKGKIISPPGGRLKYGVSQLLARILEPLALRKVRHVISVSPAYPQLLLKRYRWLKDSQFTVIPFGSAETDFEYLHKFPIHNTLFDNEDGDQHWVYVGRGGIDMAFALRALFMALKQKREHSPDQLSKVKLHFIGTDYAPGNLARKTVEPIAKECGVEDMVEEYPNRIPYFQALQCLLDADALIVPGSDDPGYTASKIYPYILVNKPLLAIFHENSSVVDVLKTTLVGIVVTFVTKDDVIRVSQEIERRWLSSLPPPKPMTNWQAFAPYTAREMAKKLCEVFDHCLV